MTRSKLSSDRDSSRESGTTRRGHFNARSASCVWNVVTSASGQTTIISSTASNAINFVSDRISSGTRGYPLASCVRAASTKVSWSPRNPAGAAAVTEPSGDSTIGTRGSPGTATIARQARWSERCAGGVRLPKNASEPRIFGFFCFFFVLFRVIQQHAEHSGCPPGEDPTSDSMRTGNSHPGRPSPVERRPESPDISDRSSR